MKKTLLFISVLVLFLVSCVKVIEPDRLLPQGEKNGLVAVTMELEIPAVELQASTKAKNFSERPQIESIHVAVFGTSGYPQAYELAEPVDESGNPVSNYASTNNEKYYFKVLLPVYDGEAHVHIIANGDESITFVDQDEESIMTTMYTSNKVGAFWTRVILKDGIMPEKDENGIMTTNQDKTFKPDAATKMAFQNLVLIRNFAEVTVSLDDVAAQRLTNVTWTLVNIPTKGSVAPMAAGTFVDDYVDYTYNASTGKMVNGTINYEGYLFPDDPMDYSVPNTTSINTAVGTPMFMYERPHPVSNPTCLLIKAQFQPEGQTTPSTKYTYYRVDLMNEAIGGVFPIYRNYKYQVKIHKVGNAGSDTPEEAMNHPSGGNVSQSTDAQKLTDISDGYSRLYVEYVEKNFTSGGKKTLWVQYVPDVTTGNVDNSTVTLKIKSLGGALIEREQEGPQGEQIQKEGVVLTPKTYSQTGYCVYEFDLNNQSTQDLVSMLQVKADNSMLEGIQEDDISTLYRDITLRVLKTLDFTLSLAPKQVQGITTTVLNINLPNGLPQSMFPLEFHIEDVNHTLNPTGLTGKQDDNTKIEVPVKVAKSLADGITSSFYFIRTINWSEYEAGSTISTQFTTIENASATTIYVYNEYFNKKSINLLNDGLYVNPANATVAFSVNSMEIEVETDNTDRVWTIRDKSQGVTVTDLDGNELTGGTGTKKFIMHFPVNNSTTASVPRTLTVTSGSGSSALTQNVTITQLPLTFSITPSSQTALFNATSATVTVNAEEGKAWKATVSGTSAALEGADAEGKVSGVGTQELTVKFDANTNNTSSRDFTVTATMTDPAATATATITQGRGPNTTPANFTVDNFTYVGSNRTGSAISQDGYISISLANIGNDYPNYWNETDYWGDYSFGPRGDGYIQMGYRSGNWQSYSFNRGSITVTPAAGLKITGITVTYVSSTSGSYDTDYYTGNNVSVTVSDGTYTRLGATGTWTGSSIEPVTFNNGYRINGGSFYAPQITSIQVTYEAI